MTIHGEFKQLPDTHYKSGCPTCGYISTSNSKRLDTESFILKSIDIHGDKYYYSLVDYINSKEKVTIICPIHGEFKQSPNSHLSGYGCSKCANESHVGLYSDINGKT